MALPLLTKLNTGKNGSLIVWLSQGASGYSVWSMSYLVVTVKEIQTYMYILTPRANRQPHRA